MAWRGKRPVLQRRFAPAAYCSQPRRRFLEMVRRHIIFLSKDDELSKVILRQHQTEAVEKVIERVYDPDKRRGLVWHIQGSGKTLTMISIAANLLQDPARSDRFSGQQTAEAVTTNEKPTVLMLVDRNELESQLFQNIQSYGIHNVQVAQSKAELRQILRSDYRGLLVAMIHKFDKADANLNDRANIVVLVDEAHRTTGGDLGNYLMAALPNATYIGFTDTPIDRLAKGQGTFKTFGVDDPQGYLDKYAIAESIADGTTVPLHYSLAPSDLLVDRETLDREFLDLREMEGVSEVEEIDAVLNQAVALKEMMKAEGRVAKIAQFVAQDFQERIAPMGFKAFLVAVDREACALYKEALDPLLPPGTCEVVYSPAHNDPPALKKHYLTPDQEKAIRRDFARKEALAALYGMIRSAFSDRPYIDPDFTAKTKALLRQHTHSGDIEPPAVIYEIGPQQLRLIKESDSADGVKVLNLRKLLNVLVAEEGGAKPYLLSIGERAEWVAQAYEDRRITTQEALAKFEALAEEINEADERRRALNVDENSFAIYTTLTAVNGEVTAVQAQAIDQLFQRYPDYEWNGQQAEELRSELYMALIPIAGISGYLAAANALLALKRV